MSARLAARVPAKRRSFLYTSLAYALFFGVPTLVYTIVGARVPKMLSIVHYTVATAFAMTAIMMVIEAVAALPRRSAPMPIPDSVDDMPDVSVIVSAYLPNEQALIAETILHLSTQMRLPTYKMQIILSYNTPDDLPVEDALESFRRINASFTPLRVPGSRSKAENILAALPLCRGEMTVLLDADHRPLPDAFERAYRWLTLGYDVVQGRCVVRNQHDTVLTRCVSVEFENMYAVAHTGRSLALGTAIFGGSNGYWRTSALKDVGMDPTMLTEDIDATVRAMLAGRRIVHDRSIVSSELATQDLRRWWAQRLRWAQGWLQVTLRHQRTIWQSRSLDWQTKMYWTYLLTWREVFPFLSLQIFSLLAASLLAHRPVPWLGSSFLMLTSVVTLAAGPVATLVTYRVSLWRTKERLRLWFLFYAVGNLPYVMLKNTVAMVAAVQECLGERAWVVTARAVDRRTPARAPQLARLAVAQDER